jgi:hypothetical protein
MTEPHNLLTVCEDGQPLVYGIDMLTAYHGFGFPGGVAHAFKVMELALPLLDPKGPPERREIHIATPFKGPGGRDAFEMVTRCVTDGRYTVDPGLMKPERGEILMGYVFNLTYRGKTVFTQIKDGHVREEFVLLGRKSGRTIAEEERLAFLKREMAERLLAAQASEIYEIVGAI